MESVYVNYKGIVQLSVKVRGEKGIIPKSDVVENQIFGEVEPCKGQKSRIANAIVITEKCQILILSLKSLKEYTPDIFMKLKSQRKAIENTKKINNIAFNSNFEKYNRIEKTEEISVFDKIKERPPKVKTNFFDQREKLKLPKTVLSMSRKDLIMRIKDKNLNESLINSSSGSPISTKKEFKLHLTSKSKKNYQLSTINSRSGMNPLALETESDDDAENFQQRKQLRKLAMIKSISRNEKTFKKNLSQHFKINSGQLFKTQRKNKNKQKSLFTAPNEKSRIMNEKQKSKIKGVKGEMVYMNPSNFNKSLRNKEEIFFDFRVFLNPSEIKKIERKRRRQNIKNAMNRQIKKQVYNQKQGKKKKRERKESILESLDYLSNMEKKSIFNKSNGLTIVKNARTNFGNSLDDVRINNALEKHQNNIFTFDGYGPKEDFVVDNVTYNIVKKLLKLQGEEEKIQNIERRKKNHNSNLENQKNGSLFLPRCSSTVISQSDVWGSSVKKYKQKYERHRSGKLNQNTLNNSRRLSLGQMSRYLPGLTLKRLKAKKRGKKSIIGIREKIQGGLNVDKIRENWNQNLRRDISLFEHNNPFLKGQVFDLFHTRKGKKGKRLG